MLAWLSVWSKVQTCIWPSWCHCHSLSLASVKSRLVLPFWYWLTRVVLDEGPLNGCVLYCCYAKTLRTVLIHSASYVIAQVWQITPVGGIYMLLISPIIHRLLICYEYDFDCTPSIPYHIEQILWFAASAFFFTAEFPQSLLSPGSCDHFFHGHQVFTLISEYSVHLYSIETGLFKNRWKGDKVVAVKQWTVLCRDCDST